MGLNFLNNADVEGNTTLKGFLKWGQSSGGQVQYMYRGDDNLFAKQDSNTNTLYSGTSYFQIKNSGDNGVLFTVENTGDVGIGTTNPSRKLQVIGTDGAAKFYYNSSFTNSQYSVMDIGMMTSGTAADGFGPKITFRMGENGFDGFTSATIGTKRSGADNTHDLTFATSNAGSISNKMVIAADGDVGIGTTDPDYKLEVTGGNGIFVSENNAQPVLSADSATGIFKIGDADELGDGVYATNTGTSSFDIYSAGSLKFRMNSNGDVGIGTTNPLAKLTVSDAASTLAIRINNTKNSNWTAGEKLGSLDFYGNDTSGGGPGIKGSISSVAFDTFGAAFDMTFSTNSGVASPSERMRIKSTGNVGIGTDDPSTQLDVIGGNDYQTLNIGKSLTDNSTKRAGITFTHYDTDEQDVAMINSYIDSGISYVSIGGSAAAFNSVEVVRFYTASNTTTLSGTERMRIANNGNVGIGTTAPSSLLHMANGSGLTFKMERTGASASTYTIANASDRITHNYVGGSAGYVFAVEGTNKMTIAENGNVVISGTTESTNFILSSDSRLKKNIKEVDNKSIKADWKTFELKTEKGQKRYGVIAQELEKTNPEFVRENTQGFKSVAYIDLLIAKIAELEVRIQKLEK